MKRLTVLLCFFTLISCQDKVICPAYQSTYILDDDTRNAYFSYVWQLDEFTRSQFLSQQQFGDSTGSDSLGTIAQPKTDYYAHAGEYIVPWRQPKKTKYGIVKPVFYPIKKYRMRTAPMENVLAPEPLSNDFTEEDFGIDSIQSDTLNFVAIDSIASDSILVAKAEPAAPKKKDEVRFLYGYDPSDNFNVEQLYYNKYFAERLIDKRSTSKTKEKEVVADDSASNLDADSTSVNQKRGLKGLFKRKNKSNIKESDSEEQVTSEVETQPASNEEPQPEQPEGNGNGGQY